MSSIIKVDNIQDQCGSAVVTKCGASKTLTVTTTKADNYQAADGGNIINQCGTTITLGASGDTIQLACGASQTGFGRTGTVDWDTTAKTANFTAVSGNGYFVDTTSGAITVTLPAGNAGDIVGISDYASTFQTNNLTITPNGTDKINGVNNNAALSTQGLAVSLVYVDSTKGWKSVTGSDNDTTGVIPTYIVATGGTVTCCGDYKVHTFTSPGTFTVCSVGNPFGSTTVDYLVVAGGGGGARTGGGGGAGGYRESSGAASGCYTVSPLGACVSALPVTAQGYPISVGGGGAGTNSDPTNGGTGSSSVFSTITSAGGGGGGAINVPAGSAGGNGGGGGGSGGRPGGAGNTPPVSPPQGNPGGPSYPGPTRGEGGGGGATATGGTGGNGPGGAGGAGATSSINFTPTARAGGGGGGGNPGGTGGTGGGGAGGFAPGPTAVAGTANTGGGGGGRRLCAESPTAGASGGSGIVIIRYKYQ